MTRTDGAVSGVSTAENYSREGVTTMVESPDGSSPLPIKDFLERIFYECEGKIEGRPWALLVSAGQDGAGAISSVERIVTGLRLKKVREPILALKEVTPGVLVECEELGAALAAGLALGIY